MSGFNSALIIGASGGIGHAIHDHLKTKLSVNTIKTLSRRDNDFDITDEQAVWAQALHCEKN